MLSTKDEPATDIRLPEQASRILDILRSTGEPMTRNDISEALGKNALNAGDLALLEVMELNGLVEIHKEPVHTPMGYQWVYRAVVEDGS